jgi:hypothetical protein
MSYLPASLLYDAQAPSLYIRTVFTIFVLCAALIVFVLVVMSARIAIVNHLATFLVQLLITVYGFLY